MEGYDKSQATFARAIKHIIAQPSISIEMLQEVSVFKESLGSVDTTILTQFLHDIKDYPASIKPKAIFKYINEEIIDP